MRDSSQVDYCLIEHVYHEFNADVDSTANDAIDNYDLRRHLDGSVIDENWSDTVFSGSLVHLRTARWPVDSNPAGLL